jgi:hypothetical protein
LGTTQRDVGAILLHIDQWKEGASTNQHPTLPLVGGFNPSEKTLVSWNYYSQYMEK